MISSWFAPAAFIVWITLGCALPNQAVEAPSPNILDYYYSSTSSGPCAVLVQQGALVFPNAKIDHSPNGFIDCTTRLRFTDIPAGYRFEVHSVSVAGYAKLDKGSFVEKIQVQVSRPGGLGQINSGTARNLYGQGGTGFDGNFNLNIPLSRPNSGLPCSAAVSMDLELFISLSHEQIIADDTAPHAGSIGGEKPDQKVRVSIDAQWQSC